MWSGDVGILFVIVMTRGRAEYPGSNVVLDDSWNIATARCYRLCVLPRLSLGGLGARKGFMSAKRQKLEEPSSNVAVA